MVKNHGIKPKYALSDLHYLIEEDAWELGTRRCIRDTQELGLTRQQIRQMLLCLTAVDHHKAHEAQGSEFGLIDVDAYRLWYDEERGQRRNPGHGMMFYVKLGVHTDINGSTCVVVSFHPDRQR